MSVKQIKKISLKRSDDSHKGTFGHALIWSGSKGMAGAAYLTSMSALRSGAGKVTLASCESVLNLLIPSMPDALTLKLHTSSRGIITLSALKQMLNYSTKVSALGLGPGLGISYGTKKVINLLIQESELPMVIDADAINALSGDIQVILRCKRMPILTPHDKEFKTLFRTSLGSTTKMRLTVAKQVSTKYHCVLISKGNRSLVVRPHGKTFVNTTGNSCLASAGTGDVLTGIVTSLLAQGFDNFDAASLGVYIHGLAADKCSAKIGVTSFVASDLLNELPSIFKSIEQRRSLRSIISSRLI